MSQGLELDVDLDHNRAEAILNVRIAELFVNDELRLWEFEDGWRGIHREDDAYYYVDTRLPTSDFCREIRIGQNAVENIIRNHIADPDAGGVGTFIRGYRP